MDATYRGHSIAPVRQRKVDDVPIRYVEWVFWTGVSAFP